jgi:hypothetical protein
MRLSLSASTKHKQRRVVAVTWQEELAGRQMSLDSCHFQM